MNRRTFISGGLAAGATAVMGADNPLKKPRKPADQLIWVTKYQLGQHDQGKATTPMDPNGHFCGDTFKKVDEDSLWRRMKIAKDAGCTMIRVNVLESLCYPSHPEISLKGSWSPEKMYEIMARIRSDYGLETVPCLNFSTSHNNWLGWYSRMVSTPKYYQVCKDLIKDVYDVFGHPRFVLFGMDEESADSIKPPYGVVRSGELYWHDLHLLVDEIEKLGARGWCSADKIWWGSKEFCENMPKSVLLSNWYYASTCDVEELRRLGEKAGNPKLARLFEKYLKAFDELEAAGYDQLPEGSLWYDRLDKAANVDRAVIDGSFGNLVRHCTDRIDPDRLKGFSMTHWCGTRASSEGFFKKCCDIMAKAKQEYAAAAM